MFEAKHTQSTRLGSPELAPGFSKPQAVFCRKRDENISLHPWDVLCITSCAEVQIRGTIWHTET